MFSDLHLRTRAIIFTGTLFGSIVWFVILLARDVPPVALFGAFLNLGIVVLALIGAWTMFVRYAWRWKLVRLGGWLVRTPDLNGRWEGTYRSSFDNKERRYVLEIRQTLTALNCTAWGEENEAEIQSAHLLSNRDQNTFKLSYLYLARRRSPSRIPGDHHDGWVSLKVIDGTPKKLRGEYVNNRDPQPTKGEIEAKWVSKKLKGEP